MRALRFGDYLGVAPPILPDVPAVPVWVDTRTGSPDPFVARVGMAPEVTFGSWRAARFSTSQISNPAIGGTGADPDTDGHANLLEYAFGLNPCIADQPVFARAFSGSGAAVAFSAVFERVAGAADLSYAWTRSADLRHWSAATPGNVVVIPDPIRHTETVESNFEPVPDASQFYRLGVTLSR